MHQRHTEHGGLRAGDAAGFAEQDIRRVHVGGHLVCKRHGQHAVPSVFFLQRCAKLFVPPRQHAEQRILIRYAADRLAERHGVAAADAAGHDEVDPLVLRQPKQLLRGLLGHWRGELCGDGHTADDQLFRRHPGSDAVRADGLMR